MSSPMDFPHLQDVMSSLPMLKRYIVLSLFFHSKDTEASVTSITSLLAESLGQLAEAFPFLTGRVIYEGRDEKDSGKVKVVSYHSTIQLVVKDFSDNLDVPSMGQMSQAKYPFSMLKSDDFVPPIGLSWMTDGFDKTAPVLILQAIIVRGGLVLTFLGNHTIMDMTGLGMIIALFAKACRNEPFTDEEIQQGNQDRRNVIPPLGQEWQPGPELDDSITKPSEYGTPTPTRWVYFNLSATSLARLKTEAGKQDVVPYISTDDAISALCWQAVTKSREPFLGCQTPSQVCRVVSVRKHFSLKGYIGHLTDCVYEREVEVWQRPLGEIAGRLRHLILQDEKVASHFRGFATLVDRLADKSAVQYGANLNTQRDVIFSSYTNIGCCELSFGPVLGMPDAARRPNFPTYASGLCYVMPKARDGSIAVGMSMTDEEISGLRSDPVFTSFAEYVG